MYATAVKLLMPSARRTLMLAVCKAGSDRTGQHGIFVLLPAWVLPSMLGAVASGNCMGEYSSHTHDASQIHQAVRTLMLAVC